MAEAETDVCQLCGAPLDDESEVVQIVRDRHPTYDREIVLHTFHRSCCDSRVTATHDCPHCGCLMYVALLRQGADYQNLARELFCPFCATPFASEVGS
ncbi:MAG: hypothetical protein ACOC7S_00635 [Planctomycetota bacterium]